MNDCAVGDPFRPPPPTERRSCPSRGLLLAATFAVLLARALPSAAMPNPAPLRFMSPSPKEGAVVTASPINIKLDAACTFDPATLAVSLNGGSLAAGAFLVATISTLIAQAEAGNCDVIAKGVLAGITKGFVYDAASDQLDPDESLETPLAESALRTSVGAADVLTYTGVPAGAGRRLGIDRDRDGFLDRTEAALASDPASPNSNPWGWQP